jgi:(4S)-4-hydroxy-5-phosphonooxypentane-2,3-dione isomerase
VRDGGQTHENPIMLIVHVDVSLVADDVEAFLAATRDNAAASLREAGVLRFDVVQDLADPAHVVLVEVYRDAEAAAAHKQTAHYATWRDIVAPLMAVPRSSVKFAAVHPVEPVRWDTPASDGAAGSEPGSGASSL